MKLHISNDLSLPLEMAGKRTAIFGISGSGKSNTATVLIEQLITAGEQVVLVDPKGEGWGLLSTSAGKPSNLPLIVFGEPNGHIPAINESHGPKLADFVVETGQSVVLSLLGFESDQSERRFVATFLRQLYRRKSQRGQPTRTLVVLDEAHLFVPENVRGDGADLAGAVTRIVRQGRSFGIGTLMVDQRPQDVSKRVITQCDSLICHQLTHKLDRDALREWVRGYDTAGQGDTFLESLASLKPGEAWIWSPAANLFRPVKIDRRKTFDSGAAPDGSSTAKKVSRAEINLESLRGQLEEIVEKAKADDPKELRRKIAELEKKLREALLDTIKEIKTEIVEVPVLKNGQLEKTEKVIGRTDTVIDRLESLAEKLIGEEIASLKEENNKLRQLISPAFTPKPAATKVAVAKPIIAQPMKVHASPSPRQHAMPVQGGLTGPEQRILDAIAWLESIGVDTPEQTAVAFLAGYTIGGGAFNNPKGRLRGNGLIEYVGDCLRLTDTGRELANKPDSPLTTDDLHRAILARLPGPEQRLLKPLLEVYPNDMSNEELAEASGYSGGGGAFNNPRGRLRSLGLVEYPSQGRVRARSILFLE